MAERGGVYGIGGGSILGYLGARLRPYLPERTL
jgi:hypothetical protein